MSIMEEHILNDIREMLSASYPDVEISMETLLEYGQVSCLDMTSLEIVQFIVDLEKKYDIIIDKQPKEWKFLFLFSSMAVQLPWLERHSG